MLSLSEIRKDYMLKDLQEAEVNADPMEQFKNWLQEAINAQVNEPTAMNLATVSDNGRPSSRILLLKGLETQGLVFYTNYESRKGADLQARPYAAITFFWPELERQVRIEGSISKVNAEASDSYFLSRPFPSQVGAMASPQSQVIKNREELEKKNLELTHLHDGKPLKRPAHWGGYALQPDYFEFWQGRPSRLHDRIAYFPVGTNQWEIKRLAP